MATNPVCAGAGLPPIEGRSVEYVPGHPLAACQGCGRDYLIRKDGTMPTHRDRRTAAQKSRA